MHLLRRASPYATLLTATFLAACSSKGMEAATTGAGGHDAGPEGTGATGGAGGSGGVIPPFVPGPHAAPPQVVNLGGKAIAHPKIQAIVYGNDPNAPQVEKFLQELTKTSYWSDTTSEYGVGALTILPAIMLPGTAPGSTDDNPPGGGGLSPLQQALASNITGTSPAWGKLDESTIYMFVMPQGAIVNAGGNCCTDFDGYHDEADIGPGMSATYAVSCACPGFDGPKVKDLQQLTVSMSHELVEAATDPLPNSDTAFGQTDDADIIWTLAGGGEVADMCEFSASSYVIPPGGTFMTQQSWSNKAAKAGTNPCVPSADPYFTSMPEMSDKLHVSGVSGTVTGVKIAAVGQSKTIPLQLWSDAKTSGPWKVSAFTVAEIMGAQPNLKIAFDKDTGNNGDTIMMTITVLAFDPQFGIDGFVISSDLGGQESLQIGSVGSH